MVNSNVELALGPEKKVITFVGQGDTVGLFRVRDERIHLRASAKPESSAVLLLREVESKIAGSWRQFASPPTRSRQVGA